MLITACDIDPLPIIYPHFFSWASFISYSSVFTYFTLQLKIKKLSTNSPRDFNSVLDTINHYWIAPAEYSSPNTSSLSAIYESFKSKVFKVVESKNGHHFY